MATRVHDCVGAFVIRDGQVLLGLRSDDCDWLAGAWDVFGGHVEPGETGLQALARELAEELGIVPLDATYMDTIEGSAPEPWRLRLYRVVAWQGVPRNLQPDEHFSIRWCALPEAQACLAAAHPEFPGLLARALQTNPE